MRWLLYISLLALLCGCSSRRTVVSSSERYTADSLAMGSQFVLDSVWRDSCTIVQTIIEFETENRPRVWAHMLADGAESALTCWLTQCPNKTAAAASQQRRPENL